MSRSPGIGLLYFAKEGVINNASFQEALAEFEKIYPGINMAEPSETSSFKKNSYIVNVWYPHRQISTRNS